MGSVREAQEKKERFLRGQRARGGEGSGRGKGRVRGGGEEDFLTRRREGVKGWCGGSGGRWRQKAAKWLSGLVATGKT
jgi:hypothetical protein